MTGMLDAALSYAARGWFVFPVKAQGKEPATPHGVLDATIHADTIRAWWSQQPATNIGIAAGPSGLIIVDVDAKSGGRDSWGELLVELGREIGETVCCETGGGGLHFYYRADGQPIRNSAGRLGPGLDIRADGGYVVAPPSIHPSGGEYTWALGSSPRETEIKPFPAVLAAKLAAKPDRVVIPQASTWLSELLSGVGEGKRNDAAIRLAGLLRRRGFDANTTLELLKLWNGRNSPPLSDDELIAVCQSAQRYDAPVREIHRFTADELLRKDFPELRWIVDDLLPEGTLTLLASRSKLGKSWLCLQLATTVAGGGGRFLGRQTHSARVIFFALEDAERQIRDRLVAQGAGRVDNLIFFDGIPPLDGEGLEYLSNAITQERATLVIIDTLAAAKTGRLDENAAGQTADLMNALRNVAHDSGAAILLAHHHNKLNSGDVLIDLRGSTAFGAAADTICAMYRKTGEQDGTFAMLSRVCRDLEFAVTFDENKMRWDAVGGSGPNITLAEKEILDCLRMLGEADAGTIAKEMDRSRQGVADTLQRLVGKAKIHTRAVATAAGGSKKILYQVAEVPPHMYRERGR